MSYCVRRCAARLASASRLPSCGFTEGPAWAGAHPWISLARQAPCTTDALPGGSRRGMAEVRIPFVDKKLLQIKFARSSGAGGQHVNKTESKVDMRISLDKVELPPDVRERLIDLNSHRINKENELVVTADGSRARHRNYEEALGKMAEIMEEAATPPKERNMNSKTKGKFNANRLLEKKAQSQKKQARTSKIDY